MKADRISYQNFNGRLIYITKEGQQFTKDLTKRLPYSYGSFKRPVRIALAQEPFDVYISRGESALHFNIQAGNEKLHTVPRKIKLEPNENRIYSATEYYKNEEDLEEAIYESINDYNMGNYAKI